MVPSRGGATVLRSPERRVLGVDPGLACTGYAVVAIKGTAITAVTYGTIKPPARLDFFGRLRAVHDGLAGVIEKFAPDEMAVEEIFYHRNVKAALTLGHARGAALAAGLSRNVAAYQYTALQVKKAVVGYGRAEKAQVQKMLRLLLGLKEAPQPEDASDALAVALTHSLWRRLAEQRQRSGMP